MVKITKPTIKVKAPKVEKKVKKVKEAKVEDLTCGETKEVSLYEEFMAKVDFLIADIAKFERTSLTRQEINAIAVSVLK